MGVERVARLALRRIFMTDPEYYDGLLEKADAYDLTLFEYVRRRVEIRKAQKEKRHAEALAE